MIQVTEQDKAILRQLKRKVDTLDGPGVWNSPDNISMLEMRGATGKELVEAGSGVGMFQVTLVGNDVLVAKSWDGEKVASSEVSVVKPMLLRSTGIHSAGTFVQLNGSFSYAYTNAQERVVTNTADSTTETQVIVPAYETVYPFNVIWAVKGISGGVNGGEEIWLDLNVAGRAWAKKTA